MYVYYILMKAREMEIARYGVFCDEKFRVIYRAPVGKLIMAAL